MGGRWLTICHVVRPCKGRLTNKAAFCPRHLVGRRTDLKSPPKLVESSECGLSCGSAKRRRSWKESRWSLWDTNGKLALRNEHVECVVAFRGKRVILLFLTFVKCSRRKRLWITGKGHNPCRLCKVLCLQAKVKIKKKKKSNLDSSSCPYSLTQRTNYPSLG